MITPGKTYQFSINGYVHQGKVQTVTTLGDGKLWVSTSDGEDYITYPEEMTEIS